MQSGTFWQFLQHTHSVRVPCERQSLGERDSSECLGAAPSSALSNSASLDVNSTITYHLSVHVECRIKTHDTESCRQLTFRSVEEKRKKNNNK